MTPYQRGCRDALLDLAAQLDKDAARYEEDANRIKATPGYDPSLRPYYGLFLCIAGKADALRAAAIEARIRAKRTPDDPKETTP